MTRQIDVSNGLRNNNGQVTSENVIQASNLKRSERLKSALLEPGRISPHDHAVLQENIRFAKDSGAEVVKLKGRRVADALIEFARKEGITHVIFGQSMSSRWGCAAAWLSYQSVSP